MSIKIAILSPKPADKAETFIQNHIKNLPYEKIVIHGDNFPYMTKKYGPSLWQLKRYATVRFFRRLIGLKTKSIRKIWLKKTLTKEKVDLVFAEYLITAAETYSVCSELNIPLVAIALGYDISQYDILDHYKVEYHKMLQYSSIIFVVAKHMKANLLKFGCDETKIIYSPAGPDVSFFQIKPSLATKNLVAIGRFVDKKAPMITIKAFSEIRQSFPKAKLLMAGDGPLLKECQDLVNDLGMDQSVEFLGRIDQISHPYADQK